MPNFHTPPNRLPRVYVRSCGIVTSAGFDLDTNLSGLRNPSGVHRSDYTVDPKSIAQILQPRRSIHLRYVDPAVLLGVAAARQCYRDLDKAERQQTAVICASSRGATTTIETQFCNFLEHKTVAKHASPSSTLGSFASTIATDLESESLNLSVSQACTGSLHAIGLGLQLIRSGFSTSVLCGGAEKATTAFTLAQLKSAEIFASSQSVEVPPYQPFSKTRSGMVLGDGGAFVMLATSKPESNAIELLGYGASSEASGPTGISDDARCLQQAILQALHQAELSPQEIDLIVTHGAGTQKGDAAELSAYDTVFSPCPSLATFKWLTGHTLGAAGAISTIIAAAQLQAQEIFATPYQTISSHFSDTTALKPITHCLVTGLGFGGNAAAIVLRRC